MTDDNESQEHKAIDSDIKEEKSVKKRSVSSGKKLKLIEKEEIELEEKLREIKKEKKIAESEYNKKICFLIGKATWEDLEDQRCPDETEYNKKLDQLKRILKSKIKTKADIEFLKSASLMGD